MIDRHLDKIIDLAFVLSPFGEAAVAALQLVGTHLPAVVNRDYVFPLLERSVRRYINYGFPLSRKELAKRNLVRTLVRAIQLVFDYSLDHATHFVFCLTILHIWT